MPEIVSWSPIGWVLHGVSLSLTWNISLELVDHDNSRVFVLLLFRKAIPKAKAAFRIRALKKSLILLASNREFQKIVRSPEYEVSKFLPSTDLDNALALFP